MSSSPESGVYTTPAGGLRERARTRFAAWLDRRIPRARQVTLNQRRIFIMPSRVGLFFAVCLLVMLLTAINYQNNMSYALTFLLATLFIVAILHTYANVAGITLHARHAEPAWPGQRTGFALRLEHNGARPRFGLRLSWKGGDEAMLNLAGNDCEDLVLHCPVAGRGWFHPGRLLVESSYPLGLLRCWSWVDLDLWALVYPAPLACAEPAGLGGDQPDGHSVPVDGSDDFQGFRDYRPGDSLRQVHWKGHAGGQPLQSKIYGAYASRSVWLDWEAFAGLPVERRLSHLCYWALQLAGRNEEFGLRLPEREISPDTGERQLETVLRALALYGQRERP